MGKADVKYTTVGRPRHRMLGVRRGVLRRKPPRASWHSAPRTVDELCPPAYASLAATHPVPSRRGGHEAPRCGTNRTHRRCLLSRCPRASPQPQQQIITWLLAYSVCSSMMLVVNKMAMKSFPVRSHAGPPRGAAAPLGATVSTPLLHARIPPQLAGPRCGVGSEPAGRARRAAWCEPTPHP